MATKTTVQYYVSKNGHNPVDEFLNSLSSKQQTKILRILSHIEQYGLVSIIPHVKKLVGTPLWEIRILGKDNIRIIYIVPENIIVLVLHGFIKKSQKTPKNEIQTALSRYLEWRSRNRKK